jgi:molecular chaperone DnaK
VHAKDTATGKDQRITITANSGLSEDQIKNMVKEAAEHEAEDKERREQIDRRNKLDNLCYTLEKTMSENKDKLPASDVSTLEGIIREARAAIDKQDDEAVKAASDKLEKEAHRLASVMYQGAPGGPGGPTAGGPPPGDGAPPPPPENKDKKGGVIDAEFEETS